MSVPAVVAAVMGPETTVRAVSPVVVADPFLLSVMVVTTSEAEAVYWASAEAVAELVAAEVMAEARSAATVVPKIDVIAVPAPRSTVTALAA